MDGWVQTQSKLHFRSVIVGKYKNTLGSISHISSKLLHGKQENNALQNDIKIT